MPPATAESLQLRTFDEQLAKTDPIQARVLQLYVDMHKNQTVDYVRQQQAKWTKFDHGSMTVMEALDELSTFVDQSDPDVDFSNDNHAFQSAEACRKMYPDNEWLQLTCLIHDMGKIMSKWGQPQWATVGDTFVVGCEPGDNVAHRQTFFQNGGNADLSNPMYSTKNGMYTPGCGFNNVIMSWGHDEYLYRVLRNHPECRLPTEALYVIRYHSFYPWHDKGDYAHLANDYDREMLPMIHDFNQFDLYSKVDDMPPIDELKPYYQSLIDKWLPGKLAL